MPDSIGSNVAIIRENAVLLTLREDFEVWCLPGGHINPGESFAECAIRETREEIGLDVRLTRFVGSYSRPGWNAGFYHVHLFAGEVVGGTLRPQQGEVLETRFFPFDALPAAMLLGHRHRIDDVVQGVSGVVKTEHVIWPFPGLDRWATYALRDESGLSRREFYDQHFPPLTPQQIQIDMPGIKPRPD